MQNHKSSGIIFPIFDRSLKSGERKNSYRFDKNFFLVALVRTEWNQIIADLQRWATFAQDYNKVYKL